MSIQQKVAQHARGSYGRSGDLLKHVMYDTNTFQDASLRQETNWFTQQIGSPYGASTKTAIQTNMKAGGQLPAGQSFVVEGISIALLAGIVGADTDLDTVLSAYFNIIQNSLFEIVLDGRAYDAQLPGTLFLPAVVGASAATAASHVVGDFVSYGLVKIDPTITIEPHASFSVRQTSGSPISALATILGTASDVLNTQNAQMQVRLHGSLTRRK